MTPALDPFGRDIVRRCRWALEHNNGHPSGSWSTGEQLAVALVLFDRPHLERMGYTPAEAVQRVAGGMCSPPTNFSSWLGALRALVSMNFEGHEQ